MFMQFKKTFEIEGDFSIIERDAPFVFSIPFPKYHSIFELMYTPNSNSLVVTSELQLSEPTSQFVLQSDDTLHCNEELLDIRDNFNGIARKLANHFKYSLNQYYIKESLIQTKEFLVSHDNSSWKKILDGQILTADFPFGIAKLNNQTMREIDFYLNNEIEPLVAMSHLHRAKNDTNPRHKWLDATIALELGIKEILIRKHPKMSVLLLEMPSPPLPILYGKISQEYLGERVLTSNFLSIAIQKRNELIHKPKNIEITLGEANEYVLKVEEAIFKLLKLIYPDDNIVNILNDPNQRGTSFLMIDFRKE